MRILVQLETRSETCAADTFGFDIDFALTCSMGKLTMSINLHFIRTIGCISLSIPALAILFVFLIGCCYSCHHLLLTETRATTIVLKDVTPYMENVDILLSVQLFRAHFASIYIIANI